MDVHKVTHAIPVSDEVLAEAMKIRDAYSRWSDATPEQRAQWAEEQKQARAEERATSERKPLNLDALIDKMGWTREYAEHLVQPYCYCESGRDGWEYCSYAYDEGLTP